MSFEEDAEMRGLQERIRLAKNAIELTEGRIRELGNARDEQQGILRKLLEAKTELRDRRLALEHVADMVTVNMLAAERDIVYGEGRCEGCDHLFGVHTRDRGDDRYCLVAGCTCWTGR